VVIELLKAKGRTFANAIAALMVMIASPALANSSSNADIAAPLRAAQAAKPATQSAGDDKFRSLFNSWQSLEETGVPALAAVAEAADQAGITASNKARLATSRAMSNVGVSIPSRMPLEAARMSSGYGMRTHPVLGGRRGHKGVDLAAATGTPVYATADGVVSRASWFSSYGLYISIEHGGDIQTRFAHLSRLNVADGQRVKKGDLIGFVGSTGRSTGPHLHYEVRVQGKAVNPVPYMQAEQLVSADDSDGKGG
jgi:murein DD-endopeptidase MepM/ murein hydrolase activator NlpD